MRLARQNRLPLITTILTLCQLTASSVIEREVLDLQNSTNAKRGCEFACGWHTQIWCGCGEACLTHAYNNEVYCGAAATTAAGGYWEYYTSTWVETDQITHCSTYSSWVGTPVTVDVTTTTCPPESTETENQASCNPGWKACGSVCCNTNAGQVCLQGGYCGWAGASYTAPVRVTSSGLLIITNTVPMTRTATFEPAIATNSVPAIVAQHSGGGGLSGGAIAGIVIGVILALVILIIICLILCVGAAADGILSFFGLRSRRRRRETVEKEVYYDHDSRVSDRRWTDRRRTETKKGGFWNQWGGAATVGVGLAGLAAALGVKRRYDRKKQEREDDYSTSSYYYSSSGSSDRRTRDTRRSSGRSRRQ